MIVLDTQAWVWWTEDPERLSVSQFAAIVSNEDDVIGISAISCWEIAKLVEYERLELSADLPEWFESALNYPGVTLLPLTPEVAMESASLPGDFHKDPADQIIVATARLNDCPLATNDRQIRAYPHVETVS